MKIVVTGALGHIGSRFIRSLPEGEFDEVVMLDNLRTQRYASLENLPAGIPLRFVEADVQTADLPAIFKGAFAVIHLAAVTESGETQSLREEIERINGEGTRRVARACAETGARLLFPSTTSVYGTTRPTVDEGCGPEDLNPPTPYAAGKLASERELAMLGAQLGLKFAILRLGTIFGVSPGMRFHTAVNRFAWQACAGEPLTVWSTALDQIRPYLDVGDAAGVFLFFLRHDLFKRDVHNVLTLNTTVSTVVSLLAAEVPDLSIHRVESEAMSPLSYRVLDDKVRAAGFIPQGSLAKAIGETVTFVRNMRMG